MLDANKFIQNLENKRKEVLNLYSEWLERFPDFKRISIVLESFNSNESLIEYCKHTPPPSIHSMAMEIFKKCISFKTKFTKKIASHLSQHPNTLHIHYFRNDIFCINIELVKTFIKEYQQWTLSIHNLWHEIYYLKEDYFFNRGYDRLGWEFYIKHPNLLKTKADRVEELHEKILNLLNRGKEILQNYDELISLEYVNNSNEMSLFERELEILQNCNSNSFLDEEYCFVYTLECELFVFYVGIASNPKERYEQHMRGAYSDESHLFKSKFIQKYRNEIKQNIIFEGIRRECKMFEKKYILEFTPLGNMTEGGEG